ncbi:MAG: hypothetical protein ACLFVY_13185 [Phycisphaerae bacterium]
MTPPTETIARQESWILENDTIRLAVTRLGGHMAPVTFAAGSDHPMQPYYISPWQDEGRSLETEVLRPLRGNFFCMPFGGENRYRGEDHPAHGEPATRRWKNARIDADGPIRMLTARMDTTARPGRVTKTHALVDGHDAVYTAHRLEGYSGAMCLGHHATLAVPERPGGLLVSSSPFELGMTNPSLFSNPADGEYQSLAIGKRFRSLGKVPTLWKDRPWADCSEYPAREGFTDLIALMKTPRRTPAWMTAVCPEQGYLWFSLKDAAVLPTTAMWISNRGRHGEPWCGRNRCLGLEDVCAYFADGLTNSAKKNELTEAGFPTTVSLRKNRPADVRYIEGAVRVKKSFGRVRRARFARGGLTFVDENGNEADVRVNHDFLATGELNA